MFFIHHDHVLPPSKHSSFLQRNLSNIFIRFHKIILSFRHVLISSSFRIVYFLNLDFWPNFLRLDVSFIDSWILLVFKIGWNQYQSFKFSEDKYFRKTKRTTKARLFIFHSIFFYKFGGNFETKKFSNR